LPSFSCCSCFLCFVASYSSRVILPKICGFASAKSRYL
jgi:hypothetical protein